MKCARGYATRRLLPNPPLVEDEVAQSHNRLKREGRSGHIRNAGFGAKAASKAPLKRFAGVRWVEEAVLDFDSHNFDWPRQRICVVAPHPDDDVLGCGGTLARAWATGSDVRVLYVTDGSASHPGSRAFPANLLCRVRETEACAALAILGLPETQLRFMREPDGGLAQHGPDAAVLADRIAAYFAQFSPTMVFSPWVRDGHSDHVATSLAVRRALARSDSSPTLYEYTVWLEDLGATGDAPAPGEAELVRIDVSAFRERKARAIGAHRSQLGAVIADASDGFVLPPSLLQRSDVDSERFFRIAPGALAR